MNTCYKIEELISFANDPCQEKHAELAAHLLHCSRCNDIYRACLDEYEMDEEEDKSIADLSAAEYEDAKKSVTKLFEKHSLWNQIWAIADRLQEQIAAQTKNLSSLLQPSYQRQTALSFAAPSTSSRRVENDQICFTFESLAAADSSDYWKMRMTLPQIISKYANIRIQITDAAGNNIPGGTLQFLNKEIAISGGYATLPLIDFLTNKSCNSISFKFSSGTNSEGTIRFLPNAF